MDGVNITNTGLRRGRRPTRSCSARWARGVTTDFIKETQVKTAGFEAEYGQATGGVVNVVTKSGSNEFHGSVFGYFRPAGLESDWQAAADRRTARSTRPARENTDFGVTLGGPLMKDKLFFFGAFNPQYQTRTLIGARTSFPLAQPGRGRPQAAGSCPTPAS